MIISDMRMNNPYKPSTIPRSNCPTDKVVKLLQSTISHFASDDCNITFYCANGTIRYKSAHFRIHSKLIREIMHELPAKEQREFSISLPSISKMHIHHLKNIITTGKTNLSKTESSNPTSLQNVTRKIAGVASLLGINILSDTLHICNCNLQTTTKTSSLAPPQYPGSTRPTMENNGYNYCKENLGKQINQRTENQYHEAQQNFSARVASIHEASPHNTRTSQGPNLDLTHQPTKTNTILLKEKKTPTPNMTELKSKNPQATFTSLDLLKYIFKIGSPQKTTEFPESSLIHLESSGLISYEDNNAQSVLNEHSLRKDEQ